MNDLQIPSLTLRSGGSIPQLGLGTFLMRGEVCEAITLEALNIGYRHIDTAMVYQNEEEVGRAIARSEVARDDLYVTTKLANSEQTDPFGGFERSLDRLGLEQVDLYLLHWPLPLRDTAHAAWKAMVQIAESGRAKAIGVCNFESDHLDQLIDATGVVPEVNQIELHPEHQRRELVAHCRDLGIVVQSWGPLAQMKSALLTNPAITNAAAAHDKTAGQVVLRWHIEHGNVVIPKTATPSRLAENAALFDFELSPEEVAAIDALETGTNYGPDPRTHNG